jgi:hypothetical protein
MRIFETMVFQKESQREDFYKCWNTHLKNIYHNDNPENLTSQELAKEHWMPFQLFYWDWENHVYKPEIKQGVRHNP